MKNWPFNLLGIFVSICSISLILTGCDESGPLAKCQLPDAIQVYSSDSSRPFPVITNQDKVKHIVYYFASAKKRWSHYWDTIPGTGVTVDFKRNQKVIATAFIGTDWAILKASDTYSTHITKQEHNDLFQLLGIEKN